MKVTGEVVEEHAPYWRVVRRAGQQEPGEQFVVVDVSVDPPQQVHGPATKKECQDWARLNTNLWVSLHGQGEWT